MQFSVGDKVVHPHHGPGRITGIERREFLNGVKRYYVLEIPTQELIVYVPRSRADDIGVRPAMAQASLARVLDRLQSRPSRLPEDYKARQEKIEEKLRTGRVLQIAEAMRDLTWHRHRAHLTRKDEDLLERGRRMLAAEMALVSEVEVSAATATIDATLARRYGAVAEHTG